MQISKPKEGGDFTPKKIYLGKCLYRILAVNPDNAKLAELGQYVPPAEPEYTFEREVNGVMKKGINITIFMSKDSDPSVVDRVSYAVIDDHHLSQSGKFLSINKYGADAWLEEANITSGVMSPEMSWYIADGVKKALRGEKELIAFIRALYNFKNITDKSTTEDKEDYVSTFSEEELKKMIAGDVSAIRNILLDDKTTSVGFLLGARTTEEGKVYQDIYKEYPLRKYMVSAEGSDQYIVKSLEEAQRGGKYSNSYFDLLDLKSKEYDPNAASAADNGIEDDDDLFG